MNEADNVQVKIGIKTPVTMNKKITPFSSKRGSIRLLFYTGNSGAERLRTT